MGVNGQAKGGAFEREVAHILNGIFGIPCFSRSAGSGARFGGKNAKRLNIHNRQSSKNQIGDISVCDNVILLVECKSYKALPFHQIIQGSCTVLDGWLSELKNDRDTFEKIFKERRPTLLVFKINRAGTYFVVPCKQLKIGTRKRFAFYPKIVYKHKGESHYILTEEFIKKNLLIKKLFIKTSLEKKR